MSIQITYEFQKSELECCICYDDISPPIIQCSSGNHSVCDSCKQKIHSKCPICRTSKLFHNQLLEKQLSSCFEPCGYSKCDKKSSNGVLNNIQRVAIISQLNVSFAIV